MFMDFFRKNGLLVTVFITGAAVLVVEILALRILAPYYGNTIFSASSVISIILAALSLGYYGGGKLADKYPSLKIFFATILTSGFLIFFLQAFIMNVLPKIAHNFSLIWGPLLMATIMFFVPALLLGTLSPYVIKLQQVLAPDQGIGSISGKVFFWSTLGSILGSLATGFVLVPNFSISSIIMAVGISLIVLGLVPLIFMGIGKKMLMNILLLIFCNFVVVGLAFAQEQKDPNLIFEKDGVYQKLSVYNGQNKSGRPIRVFFQEKSLSSGMYLDSDDLLFEYSWYWDIYKILKPEAKDFMIIGAAAYTLPKEILNTLPEAEVDVVDIEPGLIDIAKEYFDFKPDDRLHDYIDDGRGFLYNSDKQYDYIFGDAFSSFYSMPTHLTTLEFFQTVKSKLTPDGIFVGNFIGDLTPSDESLTLSQIKTFKEVFPNSYFIAVDDPDIYGVQNIIFVGQNSDEMVDLASAENRAKLSKLSSGLDEKLVDLNRYSFEKYLTLRDNYAPVEYLTSLMLKQLENKPAYY